MSAMSRNKGVAFERLIARMLTESTGTTWRRRVRNLEGESDIVADDHALGHIVVECKHANKLALPAWWRQAQEQADRQQPFVRPEALGGPGTHTRAIPLLAYRQTGGPIRVQLDAHDVHAETWPAPGRYVITLNWEAAMQWLREQVNQLEVA